MQINPRKILRTLIKVFLYLLGLIILLFFLLVVLIRTEKGQDIIRKEAASYLSKKLGTSVTIGRIRTNVFTHTEVQSITVKDKSKEVLLHVGEIDINYQLLYLLNNTLSVNQLSIDTLDFRMSRAENDSLFNFDFIIRAFSRTSSTEKGEDTTGNSIIFDIDKLSIKQLHYIMDDKSGHQFYDVKLNSIAVGVEKLDLENQLYKIKSITTDGITAKLNIGTSESNTSDSDKEGLLPQISIDKISLLNNKFSILMPGAGYQSETSIRNFRAENLNLNLNSNKVDLKQILIDQHESRICFNTTESQPQKVDAVETDIAESKSFTITVGRINLRDNDLKYDQQKETKKAGSDFNPEHIHLKQLQLHLENFVSEGSTIQGIVKKFQAKEQCGLDVRQLSSGFVYTDSGIVLDKFLLKTASSDIVGDFRISYASLAAISNNPELLGFEIDLKKMLLASDEMKHFRTMVGTSPEIQKLIAKSIYLEGKLEGKVADMNIENLKMETSGIRLSASGKISGLPDPNRLQAAINLKEFSGTIRNLSRLLPAGSIPPKIAANESFNLKGKLGDNKGAYTFDLVMKSSAGDLVLKGNVKQQSGADILSYNLHALSDGLQMDKIMMDTLFGNTAFDIKANGKGINPKTAEGQATALIPSVYFKGYDYKNINLTTVISASIIDANCKINDSAVTTELAVRYSLDSLNPMLKATAHIDNIDLQRLGFRTDTLKFKGEIVADLTTVNTKHVNGTISIPHIEILKGIHFYKLDSISLDAVNVDSTQTIAIKSPFLDMNLEGYFEMDVLPDVAQNLLIDFFTVYPPTGTVFKPAYAKLKGEFKYHPVIPAFIPGLTFAKNIKFGSIVNTTEKVLMFVIAVPSAIYKNFVIDSTIFGIHTLNDTLQYALYSSGIRNPSITLNHSFIEGNTKDGNINWDIKLFNKDDSLKYNLAGKIVNDTTKFVLHLNENQVINSEKWSANQNNYTEYTSSKYIHTNLALTSGMRQLSLQSSTTQNGLPLEVKLVEFPVTTLTKIISVDTSMVAGTINGMARLVSFEPLQFTADFKVDSLNAYSINAGNLSIKAKNELGKGYSAQANLTGAENDLDLNATYSDKEMLKGRLDIRNFSTRTLHPFLNTIIRDLQGNISGSVAFEGPPNKPVIDGELFLHDIQGNYRAYNTFFRIPEEKIQFNSSGILLDDFIAYDSLGNKARVNGQIHTADYRKYSYDLAVKMDHFMALNKKSTPEQEYYGPAFLSSDLRISSTNDVLMVKGNVKVDEKSLLNVEINNMDTTLANSNGIIVYVDSLQSADSAVFRALKAEQIRRATTLKYGLDINLEMDKTSKLNIFLNKSGGEYLKVAGDANLSINMLPGGQMNMQGKFTIDNGEYQMMLNPFIKRKFNVQRGSSIQWAGSPTDATIDVIALYNVETTAEAILTGSQTTNKGAYKQRLPFEVYLILKNKLLQPSISFKLDMPEKEQNAFSGIVYSRIKQINLNESELNKQVMGLLLLQQFIPDDPLASGSASPFNYDFESAARTTAGNIVAQQLNSFISSKIKSVDIDFRVVSKADYSSGDKSNETDLTINMSKSMFNDRYTISVGSTIALEGSSAHKKNTSALAGNYAAEYKLTKDGRYRVKVYRKDQFEADNSGQVIQTGLSFVLYIDFNKYRELLIKKEELKLK